MLEQQLHKLPNTKAYINSVKENEAQFRKRRISTIIKGMEKNTEPIRQWQVMKRAGIKVKFYEEIQRYKEWKKLSVSESIIFKIQISPKKNVRLFLKCLQDKLN